MAHPSRLWLILICLLSYLSMGQAGCQTIPQSDVTYLRSDMVRLRRDIEALDKKIGAAPAGSGVNVDGIMRNQAAQSEALRELQEGQQRTESRIEETNHELVALSKEITNLQLNLIRQMESLKAQTRAAAEKPRPSASVHQAAKAPPAPEGNAVPPKTASARPAAAPVQSLDFTKLYDTAYEDYQRQNYSLARTGFEEYLHLFPETDLADNAQYWIGECYYAEGRYEDASEAFKQVITKYPSGNKVPRAMLKAGHAQLQLGNEDKARSMFQQVVDAYPLSSEADQAKSRLKKLE